MFSIQLDYIGDLTTSLPNNFLNFHFCLNSVLGDLNNFKRSYVGFASHRLMKKYNINIEPIH